MLVCLPWIHSVTYNIQSSILTTRNCSWLTKNELENLMDTFLPLSHLNIKFGTINHSLVKIFSWDTVLLVLFILPSWLLSLLRWFSSEVLSLAIYSLHSTLILWVILSTFTILTISLHVSIPSMDPKSIPLSWTLNDNLKWHWSQIPCILKLNSSVP